MLWHSTGQALPRKGGGKERGKEKKHENKMLLCLLSQPVAGGRLCRTSEEGKTEITCSSGSACQAPSSSGRDTEGTGRPPERGSEESSRKTLYFLCQGCQYPGGASHLFKGERAQYCHRSGIKRKGDHRLETHHSPRGFPGHPHPPRLDLSDRWEIHQDHKAPD